MRFCKDCAHFQPRGAVCLRPVEPDLKTKRVWGRAVTSLNRFAVDERDSTNLASEQPDFCGPDATYFKPKPTTQEEPNQ